MNFMRLWPSALGTLIIPHAALSQSPDGDQSIVLDEYVTEQPVEDSLGLLSSGPIQSVFGFDKSIDQTPRSVSSIGAEFMEAYHINSVNDIAAFVPGSFTTSFFGVAGSLDIRGTPGDNYFRGVKRLANDGTYPTAIGASDRIDVIRGPMSPISGPSRVGGALNFVPKSARAETGTYLDKPVGQMSITQGSYDQSRLAAEVGGPMSVGSQTAGYYLYAEVEASDSYYQNDFTDQTVLQASFDLDLSSRTRLEFGGMTQDWNGHENAGWNRVTQDLIDNGNYITGQPVFTPEDVNHDGLMNDAEIVPGFGAISPGFGQAVNCYTGSIQLFCEGADGGLLVPSLMDPDSIPAQYRLDPATVGVAKIDGSQVQIYPTDFYSSEVGVFYFDTLHDFDNGWSVTNKAFYEQVKSANVDAYGFSKTGDSSVIEDQLIFARRFAGDKLSSLVQLSPSVRYVDAYYANDFVHEVFDRTDLTQGLNASGAQSSPLRHPEDPWGINDVTRYTQLGFAMFADTELFTDFNLLLGARVDYVDIDTETLEPAAFFERTPGATASDSDTGSSYNVSFSYRSPLGLMPYVTYAEQSTILAADHETVAVSQVESGGWFGHSTLSEIGVKGKLLGGRLFFALASYEQERVDINSNVAESNEALKTEGLELELRYLASDKIALMATAANMKVYRTGLDGALFTYLGAADFPQIDPTLVFGGVVSGVAAIPDDAERGGIPENVYGLAINYAATENIAASLSATRVDSVEPSPLGGLVLPAYDLVNASLSYQNKRFRAALYINNLLDEQYFRANFPGLYGNLTVLPEQPRNYSATLTFKF